MKLIAILFFTLGSTLLFGQENTLSGTVVDAAGLSVPGVKIRNTVQQKMAKSEVDGKFSISATISDTILFTFYGYDTLILVVDQKLMKEKDLKITLKTRILEFDEINITRRRLEGFDVGFLPPIKGVQITTGTNSVIELAELSGAKSTSNPREIFAKVPGLNIWESDGAGIQIGIGGRGLSPNRAANFNTRQNGYDISADALGYPESYYTPPFEALKSIEIIRGSASLQYGTQFGGLLNFIIKDAPTNTPLEFTTRYTGGMYGYFGSFNRVAGTVGRFSYQVYYQYKKGDGYRENSKFNQQQFFVQGAYRLTENQQLKLEYTHMDYLAKQAGGLTDLMFEEDPKQSIRNRNWFNVKWNMLALHYNWEISGKSHFNVRAFGMLSERKSLGFLEKITQSDPGGNRTMIAGEFKNYGIEARYLREYNFHKNEEVKKINLHGAFLTGFRYYKGHSTAEQGNAPDGEAADFRYLHPDNLEYSSYDFPSENIAAFAENIFFIGKKWRINAGMRYENISSASTGYYKQYVIHPSNHDTLAIYTFNDDKTVKRQVPLFGFGTSYKAGKRSSLYTNFTQNYRAINFTDIRVTNPNFTVDSLIRDEYGYTAELGFRGLIKRYFIFDIAAFYIFYGDKIGLAPKAGTIYKERTNIGDAQNYGTEVFAEFDFWKAFNDSTENTLSLFVNAAYINANYIQSKETSYIGKKVEYVSSYILKSGLKFKVKGWSFQIQGSYNSEQFTDATNSIEPSGDAVIGLIPSYFVFDFSGRYTFKKYFQIETGVNNFTNQQYFTRRAISYPGPGILPSDGISAYITLQYQFRVIR